MKKFVAACLLAVGLLATSQQQASAWINAKFSIGMSGEWHSANNCWLWGAFHSGPYCGPGVACAPPGCGSTGCGMGSFYAFGGDPTQEAYARYQGYGYGYAQPTTAYNYAPYPQYAPQYAPMATQQIPANYGSPYQLMSYPGYSGYTPYYWYGGR